MNRSHEHSQNQTLGWLDAELAALADKDLLRSLRTAEALPHGRIRLDGKELLNLCSNDYLGLMQQLPAPAAPAGATASRLICGGHPSLIDAERALADWQQTEAALLFGSGYLANVGCLPALAGKGDVIFADKLNHASLIDGAELSRAAHVRFRHNDLAHLEELLQKHADRRRKLIVTEAVFSMDGDRAPLAGIVELKRKYGAMLMVDEAHSGGVLGPEGRGLAAELGVADAVDVHLGTLSKAFGCYGAYVAGPQTLIDFLVNRARSLIYSTALPPMIGATVVEAVSLVRSAAERRRTLSENAEVLREHLVAAGLDVGMSSTQIIPLLVGASKDALALADHLRQNGVAALAIRPPTVPVGKARIRFSVCADHPAAALKRTTELAIEWFRSERTV